jgi:uncharacterized repeat protein (TIGR03803 family)
MNRNRHQVRTFSAVIALTLFALVCIFTAAAIPAQAQTFNVVYVFGQVDPDDSVPEGQLALGRDGNFYGTDLGQGGSFARIFQITPSGAETTLWVAPPPSSGDGQTACNTGLTLGSDGLLYGTCQTYTSSLNTNNGIVFKFDPSLGQSGFTVLISFPVQASGGTVFPSALVQGTDGNFYGTTLMGFTTNLYGTVFKVSPTGTFKTLHVFDRTVATDGAFPSGLIQGSDGNFYGTSQQGGGAGNPGTVFKISSGGAFKLVHVFDNTGVLGADPWAGVSQGLDGNFYGSTVRFGSNDQGVLFKLTGAGKYTVLHNFNYTADIADSPVLPLTLGTDGNFYAADNSCFNGGCHQSSLFKITAKGVYSNLFDGFCLNNCTSGNQPNGANPSSPLLLDTSGTLYGVAALGGVDSHGNSVDRGVFYSENTGLAPFVRLHFNTGKVGTSVGIYGRGLASTSSVSFNGSTASFTVVSDTYITATIPAAASGTTGFVAVVTPSGTLKSIVKFKAKP